ncbi:MAG: hypothetical protein ABIT20_20425 [Gemmatimonadaceae bacterium]
MFEPEDAPLLPEDDRVASPPRSVTRITLALAASGITAATIIGMLLGLGRRYSTLWRPLNAAAHTVLGARADGVWGYESDVTPVGGAVVLVMSVMMGFIIALLASSGRTLHRAMSTFGIALLAYLAHVHIVARTPGGLAAFLSVGELRALYVAVAIAVFVGMRYAFSSSAGTTRTH